MSIKPRGFWPVLLLASVAVPAFAAAPSTTLIEGVLQSSGGGPAADGDYKFTFSLYDVQSGGAAAWTEKDVALKVTSGRFTYALGTTSPLDAVKVAALKKSWLGIKVGADPELPRQPLRSVIFALHAQTAAGLNCTDCVGKDAISNGSITSSKVQFAYAKAADGIKGGAAADVKCSGCVSVAEMKFDGDVDLSAHSLKAGKLTVAGDIASGGVVAAKQFVGDGSKLTGINQPKGTCKAGEAVGGINADGTLKCVTAGLPADGLNEVSNDLLTNQFTDDIGAGELKITDNNPAGVVSTINFPDIGIAQDIQVNVTIENSEIGEVTAFLFPPNAPVLPADRKDLVKNFPAAPTVDGSKYPHYLLHRKTGAKGSKIDTTYPGKTKPVAGDLHKDWIGKNPKGQWRLLVVDSKFLNNTTDGRIVKWSISLKTLSNKKVGVKGSAFVEGKLWGTDKGHGNAGGQVEIGGGIRVNDQKICDADRVGTLRHNGIYGLQVCQMNAKLTGAPTYEWFAAKSSPVIFSGGCRNHGNVNNDYAKYCLDGTDFNTASDYLDANTDGTVTVKRSGWYRINFFGITHSSTWQHLQIVKTGYQYIHHGHKRNHGNWEENWVDLTWPFKAGETFFLKIYRNSSSWNYHSWNHDHNASGWYTGSHSRLQVTYEGPMRGTDTVNPKVIRTTCKEILDDAPNSPDGMYWIDPDGKGENGPVLTYCDMTTDGGGWTLVNYCAQRANDNSSRHSVPQNMFEMRCGDGKWDAEGRGTCASLGAVEIAKKSTEILFARGKRRNTGNVMTYDVVTSFKLPDPANTNFVSPNKYGGKTGTGTDQRGACTQVKLKVIKGDKQYNDAVRYTYKYAVGVTWSDGHPTQIGATQDTNCEGSAGMSQGPSFVSVHTGNGSFESSHRWYKRSCKINGKTEQVVVNGRPNYDHNDWWDPSGWGKQGSAAVWLR